MQRAERERAINKNDLPLPCQSRRSLFTLSPLSNLASPPTQPNKLNCDTIPRRKTENKKAQCSTRLCVSCPRFLGTRSPCFFACTWIDACMYCICVHMHVCTMYVCVCVCMYISMHACMHKCLIFTGTQSSWRRYPERTWL